MADSRSRKKCIVPLWLAVTIALSAGCDGSNPTSPSNNGGGSSTTAPATGSVAVRCYDQEHNAMTGVSYTLTHSGGSSTYTGGWDTWPNIPVGTVSISASKSGYSTGKASGTLSAGQTLTLEVTLNASGGSETTGWATVQGATTTKVCASQSGNSLIMTFYYSNATFTFIFPDNYLSRAYSPVAFKYYTDNSAGTAFYDNYRTWSWPDYTKYDHNDGPGTLTMTLTSVGDLFNGSFSGKFYDLQTRYSYSVSGTFSVPYPSSCN